MIAWPRIGRAACVVGLSLLAALGCSSDRPKPTPLQAYTAKVDVRQVWTAKIDSVRFPMTVMVRNGMFVVAGTDGTLLALDAQTGREVLRVNVGAKLSAGIGSDGRYAAVVTVDNVLVVFDGARLAWRKQLNSRVSTAPFVAGERVFVMGVDRAVLAFDAAQGQQLWELKRPGEALTLLNTGVLTAVHNILVAGQGPRLVGIDPDRGSLLWEVPLAAPRGTNEVERLADLVGPAVRFGETLCARAFQSAVGCGNAVKGSALWSRPAGGVNAVGGDEQLIFGADASDRITAWHSANGDVAWHSEQLLYRRLSAPTVIGKTVAFGDYEGQVHFLDRDDGKTLLRLSTDGSPVQVTPVVSGDTLLIVTRDGGLFAFRRP